MKRRQPKRIAGLPVVLQDVNHYYLDGCRVTRSEALQAIIQDFPDHIFLSIILTLDSTSPSMGVWTSKGLVYRVSSINGR